MDEPNRFDIEGQEYAAMRLAEIGSGTVTVQILSADSSSMDMDFVRTLPSQSCARSLGTSLSANLGLGSADFSRSRQVLGVLGRTNDPNALGREFIARHGDKVAALTLAIV